jgi:hypothetical protein
MAMDAADPANRLVTGELEARWKKALAHVGRNGARADDSEKRIRA